MQHNFKWVSHSPCSTSSAANIIFLLAFFHCFNSIFICFSFGFNQPVQPPLQPPSWLVPPQQPIPQPTFVSLPPSFSYPPPPSLSLPFCASPPFPSLHSSVAFLPLLTGRPLPQQPSSRLLPEKSCHSLNLQLMHYWNSKLTCIKLRVSRKGLT